MRAHKAYSLIRGVTSNTMKGFLGGVIDNLTNLAASPPDSFPSPTWKAVDGSIAKDNWGAFGTIVADRGMNYVMNKFLDYTSVPDMKPNQAVPVPREMLPNSVYTEPANKVNSAQPATTGSVVNYSPTLSPSEAPMIPIGGGKKPVARRVRRRAPTKTTAKSVNVLTAPKMKRRTKKYRYKAEI